MEDPSPDKQASVKEDPDQNQRPENSKTLRVVSEECVCVLCGCGWVGGWVPQTNSRTAAPSVNVKTATHHMHVRVQPACTPDYLAYYTLKSPMCKIVKYSHPRIQTHSVHCPTRGGGGGGGGASCRLMLRSKRSGTSSQFNRLVCQLPFRPFIHPFIQCSKRNPFISYVRRSHQCMYRYRYTHSLPPIQEPWVSIWISAASSFFIVWR